MIIKEHNTLFVHVPKAAGQSVENYFLELLNKSRKIDGGDYLLKYNDDPLKGPERLAHLTALEYLKYNYITEEEFNTFFKFSIVRNPWSRAISFYKFRGFAPLISFNTFVRYYLPQYFEEQHWFFKPQVDFILNNKNESILDFVGKLENLEEDFNYISQQLFNENGKLPFSNNSVNKGLVSKKSFNLLSKHPTIIKHLSLGSKEAKNYKNVYNAYSSKVVEKLYEKDIDLLKYTF